MSTFFLVVGSVMALVLGAAGAVALVTGRIVLPWFQGGVSRPGLWVPARSCWPEGSRPPAGCLSEATCRSFWSVSP
ncbi:hypothetical protein ACR6C2_37050 [Streptomyces sp. INA 01156]